MELESDVSDAFELNNLYLNLVERNVKNVCLQFPDYLLKYAVVVHEELTKFDKNIVYYILADSQSSACCSDTIAASHVQSDVTVVFGRSCSSKTIQCFGKLKFELDGLLEIFSSLQNVCCIYDVMLSHVKWPALENVEFRPCGFKPTEANTVIFVGPTSPLVSHMAMYYCSKEFFHYDKSLVSTSHVQKRYRMVHQARDAPIVGILVSAYSSANYLELIEAMKQALRKRGKKYYTFSLSKLNPLKLGNFSEINVFVLVSCPQSTLIDSKEYLVPVITPFELAVALEMSMEWGSEYELEYNRLISRFLGVEETNGEPHFSLITGRLESGMFFEHKEQNKELIKSFELRSAAAYHLNTRSWKGLDPKYGEERTLEIFQGRFGNASKYDGEN